VLKPLLGAFIVLPLTFAVACGDTEDPKGGANGGAGSGTGGSSAGNGGSGGGSDKGGTGNLAGSTATAASGGMTGEGGAASAQAGAGVVEGGQPNDAGGQGGAATIPGGEAGAGPSAGGEGGDSQGGARPSNTTPSVLGAKVGELVITEVMRDPGAVDDLVGEWFEVYNTTSHAFELAGLTLADGTGSVAVTGDAIIAAKGYAVFARNGAAGNGGVTPAFVYGNEIQLSNNSDVVRLSVNTTVLDEVAFANATGFPNLAGASMSFAAGVPTPATNDVAANWCTSGRRFGAGDLGSPGTANTCMRKVADLESGDLVVTEIMADPSAVGDVLGEWFELLNPTIDAIELQGLTISDAGIDTFSITTSLIVFPGDRLVFGANATLATNGGITVDYAYSRAAFALANGADEVIISSTGVIDSVIYTAAFPATSGASMSLAPASSTAAANDTAANWCSGKTALTSGDKATPGAVNDSCP